MSAEDKPPAPTTEPTNIPIPKIVPPTKQQPAPQTIHLRVLLHGEVDSDVPDNTDISKYALLVANDIKTKAPDFKITKILVSQGKGGPVAKPL